MILHAFICVLALLILAGGLKALAAFFNAARRRATALAPIFTPPPPRFFGFPSLINIVGVALFLAAGFILSSEVLAQEQVTVHYQQIPANGIGGTLTVLGLDSGESVEKGTVVTLTAKPASTFYVFRWSHASCTETGDDDIENSGVEKTCALTVNSELSVTVTFADAIALSWRCDSLGGDNPIFSCYGQCTTPRGGGGNYGYISIKDPGRSPYDPYRCPNSHKHNECNDWAKCLRDGFYQAECIEKGFPPPPECHNKGWYECEVEAQEVIGAVCVPTPRVSVVYNSIEERNPAWPPAPPDEFRHGVNAFFHPEKFVVVSWAVPFDFNLAAVPGYEILRETNGSGNFVSVGFAPGRVRSAYVDLHPPSASTVRYMISMRSDPAPGPVSKVSSPLVIPLLDMPRRNCAAENRFPDVDPQQCGRCFLEHEEVGGFPVGSDGVCVPREGGFGGLSQEVVCGAFGGVVHEEGDGKICSAIDQAGTFCILDSKDAFPCRGLFKTVRTCNLVHERPALNPFACAEKCTFSNDIVVGDECRRNMITPP